MDLMDSRLKSIDIEFQCGCKSIDEGKYFCGRQGHFIRYCGCYVFGGDFVACSKHKSIGVGIFLALLALVFYFFIF